MGMQDGYGHGPMGGEPPQSQPPFPSPYADDGRQVGYPGQAETGYPGASDYAAGDYAGHDPYAGYPGYQGDGYGGGEGYPGAEAYPTVTGPQPDGLYGGPGGDGPTKRYSTGTIATVAALVIGLAGAGTAGAVMSTSDHKGNGNATALGGTKGFQDPGGNGPQAGASASPRAPRSSSIPMPSLSDGPSDFPSFPDAPLPDDTASAGDTGTRAPIDTTSLFSPTVQTTTDGLTYTRLTKRSGACTTYANDELKAALALHPCIGSTVSALYVNPSKSIEVTVSIVQFATPADSSSVVDATTNGAGPTLVPPPTGSGLSASAIADAQYWVQAYQEGQYILYAVACSSSGGTLPADGGAQKAAAVALGTELNVSLIWS